MPRLPAKLSLRRLDELREHEEIIPEHLEELYQEILLDGILKKPIVLDAATSIILDGHHRYNSLRRMSCVIIPTYEIKYDSPDIVVLSWREGNKVTKEIVIHAGLTGSKLQAKTSRHMLKLPDGTLTHVSEIEEDINIPLSRLK